MSSSPVDIRIPLLSVRTNSCGETYVLAPEFLRREYIWFPLDRFLQIFKLAGIFEEKENSTNERVDSDRDDPLSHLAHIRSFFERLPNYSELVSSYNRGEWKEIVDDDQDRDTVENNGEKQIWEIDKKRKSTDSNPPQSKVSMSDGEHAVGTNPLQSGPVSSSSSEAHPPSLVCAKTNPNTAHAPVNDISTFDSDSNANAAGSSSGFISFKRSPQPYALAARPASPSLAYSMMNLSEAFASSSAPAPASSSSSSTMVQADTLTPTLPCRPIPFDHRSSHGGRTEIFSVTKTQCGWIPITALFCSTPIGNNSIHSFLSILAPHVTQHIKTAFEAASGVGISAYDFHYDTFIKQSSELMTESTLSFMKNHSIPLIDYPPFVTELASRKLIHIPIHSIVYTFDHRCMVLWTLSKQYSFIYVDELFQHDKVIRLQEAQWTKLIAAVIEAIQKAAGVTEVEQWKQAYESGKAKPVSSAEFVIKLKEWFKCKNIPKLTLNQIKNRLSEQIFREMKSNLPSLAPQPFTLQLLPNWSYAVFVVTTDLSHCGWVSFDSLVNDYKSHLPNEEYDRVQEIEMFAQSWTHQLNSPGISSIVNRLKQSYASRSVQEISMERMTEHILAEDIFADMFTSVESTSNSSARNGIHNKSSSMSTSTCGSQQQSSSQGSKESEDQSTKFTGKLQEKPLEKINPSPKQTNNQVNQANSNAVATAPSASNKELLLSATHKIAESSQKKEVTTKETLPHNVKGVKLAEDSTRKFRKKENETAISMHSSSGNTITHPAMRGPRYSTSASTVSTPLSSDTNAIKKNNKLISLESYRNGENFVEVYITLSNLRGWCPLHEILFFVPLHDKGFVQSMQQRVPLIIGPLINRISFADQTSTKEIEVDDKKLIQQVRDWCHNGLFVKSNLALLIPLLGFHSRYDHRGEILWVIDKCVGFIEAESFFEHCKPIRLNDHHMKEFLIAVANEIRKLSGSEIHSLRHAYQYGQCQVRPSGQMNEKVDSWFQSKNRKKFDFNAFKSTLSASLAQAIDRATDESSMEKSPLAPIPYSFESDDKSISYLFLLLPQVCGWVQINQLLKTRSKFAAYWIRPAMIRIMEQLIGRQQMEQLQQEYKEGKLRELSAALMTDRIIEFTILKHVTIGELDDINFSSKSTCVLRPLPLPLYSMMLSPRGLLYIQWIVGKHCGATPIEAFFDDMESKHIVFDHSTPVDTAFKSLLDTLYRTFKSELGRWMIVYDQGKCEQLSPVEMHLKVNQLFQIKHLSKLNIKQYFPHPIKYVVRDKDPNDQWASTPGSASQSNSQGSNSDSTESSSASHLAVVSTEVRETTQGEFEVFMHTFSHCGWLNVRCLFRGPIGISNKDLRHIAGEARRKFTDSINSHDATEIKGLNEQGVLRKLSTQDMTIQFHQWLCEKSISRLNFGQLLLDMAIKQRFISLPWPATQVNEHRRCEIAVWIDDVLGLVPIETFIQDCRFLRVDWSNVLPNTRLIHAILSNIDRQALEQKNQSHLKAARILSSDEMTAKLHVWFKSSKKQKLTMSQIKAKLTAQHAKALTEELINSPFSTSFCPKPFELTVMQGSPLVLEVFFFIPGYCGWIPLDWLFGKSKVPGTDPEAIVVQVTRVLHLHYCVPFFGAPSATKARVDVYEGGATTYEEVSASELRVRFELLLDKCNIKKAEFNQLNHEALNKLNACIPEPVLYSHSLSSDGTPEMFVALNDACGWVPVKQFCTDSGWNIACFDMHNLNVAVDRVVFNLRKSFGKQLLRWEDQYARSECKLADNMQKRIDSLFQSKGVHRFDSKLIVEGLSLHKDAGMIANRTPSVLWEATSQSEATSSCTITAPKLKSFPLSELPSASAVVALSETHLTMDSIVSEYIESGQRARMLSSFLAAMKKQGLRSDLGKQLHGDVFDFVAREFETKNPESSGVEFASLLEKTGFLDSLLQFIGKADCQFVSKGMIRALELLLIVANINIGWRDSLLGKSVLRRLHTCEVNPGVYPFLFTQLLSTLIDKRNTAISELDALSSLPSALQLLMVEEDEIQLSAARILESLMTIIHYHLAKPMTWRHRMEVINLIQPNFISDTLFPLIDPSRYYKYGSGLTKASKYAQNTFPVVFRCYTLLFRIILLVQSAMEAARFDMRFDHCGENIALFANNSSDKTLSAILDEVIYPSFSDSLLMRGAMGRSLADRMTRLSRVAEVASMQEEAEVTQTASLAAPFLRLLEFLPFIIQPRHLPSVSLINSWLKRLRTDHVFASGADETQPTLCALLHCFDSTYSTWKLLPATRNYLLELARNPDIRSTQVLALQLINKLKRVGKM